MTVNGAALDGDNDGNPGGNYVTPAETSYSPTGLHLYRLFGDVRATGATPERRDGGPERPGGVPERAQREPGDANYLAYLDANNDGHVDLTDLTEFRNRFNLSVFVA